MIISEKNKLSAEKKKHLFWIFLGFESRDKKIFKINKILEDLSKNSNNIEVFYTDKCKMKDYFEYLNKYIENADIFLLFCSENMLQSNLIKLEWMVALKLRIPIVIIYKNMNEIPIFLMNENKIQFSDELFEENLKKLTNEILKIKSFKKRI